jgi:hypothetical protein
MADNRGRLWDSKKNESSSNELTRFLAPRDLLVLLPGVGTPSAIYVYFERDFWTKSRTFVGIQFDEARSKMEVVVERGQEWLRWVDGIFAGRRQSSALTTIWPIWPIALVVQLCKTGLPTYFCAEARLVSA